MNGVGTYTYGDGSRYVGEFKDDKRHGRGVFSYFSGDRYDGEWVEDKRHGQGTLTFHNDDVYHGRHAPRPMLAAPATPSSRRGTWPVDLTLRMMIAAARPVTFAVPFAEHHGHHHRNLYQLTALFTTQLRPSSALQAVAPSRYHAVHLPQRCGAMVGIGPPPRL